MGLDITACSHLEFIEGTTDIDSLTDEQLEDDAELVYDSGFNRLDGHPQGLYRRAGASESTSFRAGSYGTYNGWRSDLSRMALGVRPEEVWADPEAFTGKPFVELISFSDCEGAIGPETSAKLAKDFADHEERAKEWAEERYADWHDEFDWWFSKYKHFKRAFELAAQDGFVIFH